MDTRFRSSDSTGTELPWQTVDEMLDALEDGRLGADDYVFDATRQAWQPIRKHSEIVEAWDQATRAASRCGTETVTAVSVTSTTSARSTSGKAGAS